jgi:hypothetical protein
MWIKFLPYIVGLGLVIGVWFHGKDFGYSRGYDRAYEKALTIANKLDKKCPDCKCPKYEPCPPSIDYDKMKAKNIQVTIHQHNHLEVSGDSLLLPTLEQLFNKKFSELNVVRTKR